MMLDEAVVDGSSYGKLYHGTSEGSRMDIMDYGWSSYENGISFSQFRKSAYGFGPNVIVVNLTPGSKIWTGDEVRRRFLEIRKKEKFYHPTMEEKIIADRVMDEMIRSLSDYDGIDFTYKGTGIRARYRYPWEQEVRVENWEIVNILGYFDRDRNFHKKD